MESEIDWHYIDVVSFRCVVLQIDEVMSTLKRCDGLLLEVRDEGDVFEEYLPQGVMTKVIPFLPFQCNYRYKCDPSLSLWWL